MIIKSSLPPIMSDQNVMWQQSGAKSDSQVIRKKKKALSALRDSQVLANLHFGAEGFWMQVKM